MNTNLQRFSKKVINYCRHSLALLLFFLGALFLNTASATENNNFRSAIAAKETGSGSYCLTPTWLTETNLTCSGATLSWDAMPGAFNYTVRVRVVGSSTWIVTQTVSTTYFNVTGLSENTQYAWQVVTNCTNGEQSPWSVNEYFYTQDCQTGCPTPTWLMESNITCYSATLTWDAMPGVVSYTVQAKPVGSPYWTITQTTYNAYLTLSGLSQNTQYEWQIRSNCGSSSWSLWSQSEYFTTNSCQPSCPIPTWLTENNITCYGATLSWDAMPGVNSYTIQLKPVGATYWTITQTCYTNYITLSGLTDNTQYVWQVRSNCGGGCGGCGSSSPWSPNEYFTTTNCQPSCPIPTWLTENNITCYGATLSWDVLPGAVSYTVQAKPAGSSYWTITQTTSNPYLVLTGLSQNTQYVWQVRSNCGGGCGGCGSSSPWSASDYFTTDNCTQTCVTPVCQTETNITCYGATLNWFSTPNATSYTVQLKPVGSPSWTITQTVSSTFFTVSGLTDNTQYVWQVRSNCGGCGGCGSSSPWSSYEYFSTTSCHQSCTPPSGVFCSQVTQNSAYINWAGVPGATSYLLEYRASYSSYWTSIPVSGTSYQLTGLNSGTVYYVRLKTLCPGGYYSEYCLTYSFTTLYQSSCHAPSWVNASNITQTSAYLSWSPSSGASYYSVRYKPTYATTWSYTGSTNNTFFYANNLLPATTYVYEIQAYCYYGGWSAVAGSYFTTLGGGGGACYTPTNLYTSNITQNSANLSWSDVPGAISYTILIRSIGSPTWNSYTSYTNNYYMTGLLTGLTYEWKVRSNCYSGGWSEYSPINTFTTNYGSGCYAPTGLSETNISSNTATLHWNYVPGAVSYLVQVKYAYSGTWLYTYTVSGTSIDLTYLSPGTAYTWRVTANCSYGGQSPCSYERTFTTYGSYYCDAPTGVTVTNITNTSALVNWYAASGAVSYTVEYRPISGSTWNAITTNNIYQALTGLTAGTTYKVRVRSNCSYGSSGYCTEITFSTTGGSYCEAPSWLNVSNITSSSALLAWSDIPNAASYTVEYKPVSSPYWTVTQTVYASLYDAINLSPNTQYVWHVRTNCNNGYSSPYSALNYFTTNQTGGGGGTGDIDEACTAYQLPVGTYGNCSYTWSTNEGSTGSTYPAPPTSCTYYGHDVWFKVQIPTSGEVYVRWTPGTLTSITMALYWGSSCSNLSYLYCTSSSTVLIQGTPGTVVYMRLWGGNNTTGTFGICAYTNGAGLVSNSGDNTTQEVVTPEVRAIGDAEIKADAMIYPNPANTYFTVEFTSNQNQDSKLLMYNANGQVVNQMNVKAADMVQKYQINTESLPDGIYLLRYQNGETSWTKKVVITR